MRIFIPEIDQTTSSVQLYLTMEELSQLYSDLGRMIHEPVTDDHTHFESEHREILIVTYQENGENRFQDRFKKVITEDK